MNLKDVLSSYSAEKHDADKQQTQSFNIYLNVKNISQSCYAVTWLRTIRKRLRKNRNYSYRKSYLKIPPNQIGNACYDAVVQALILGIKATISICQNS